MCEGEKSISWIRMFEVEVRLYYDANIQEILDVLGAR
jgi:uncharacterized protein YqiB (DUF1249 family)